MQHFGRCEENHILNASLLSLSGLVAGLGTFFHPFCIQILMANYFYFDQNNQKQGPVSTQQLQELAAQGVIGPHTPMETDTGHRGVAGQIPGLRFNTVEPPLFEQTTQTAWAHVQRTARSLLLWLFDFAFRDIRVHIVNLWMIRISYGICWIVAILWGLAGTFELFQEAQEAIIHAEFPVSHVQSIAAGIGKHIEDVHFLPRAGGRKPPGFGQFKCFIYFPEVLPFWFDFSGIVFHSVIVA